MPDILKSITNFSENTVSLIYFKGPATNYELLSMTPYFSVVDKNKRFFVSEICKDSTTSAPVWMRICIEYSYENFLEMIKSSEFCPGIQIMGINTSEENVKNLLTKDVFNKDIFDEILRDDSVDCWWSCDCDIDRMKIWHKSLSEKDMFEIIKKEVLQKFDYPIEFCDI